MDDELLKMLFPRRPLEKHEAPPPAEKPPATPPPEKQP